MRNHVFFSTLVMTSILAVPAFAQGDDAKPTTTTTTTATTTTSAAADNTTDHERVAGKFGVGYLGQLDVPLGPGNKMPTQILGVRWWNSSTFGISAGLGFGSTSSSNTNGGTTVDGPAATAFALKGGVIFPLATGKHYTFVLEPQLVLGYATQTVKPAGGGPNTDNSGTRVAIGATAGAEIQFGFIGIPELALVGSIGLAFDTQSGKSKTEGAETSASQTSISTFTLANPWNIFAGNVAAIYYF
jgi:hypothetical protein